MPNATLYFDTFSMLGLRKFASHITRAHSRASHYFAAIDQGTSSSRVILYDSDTLAPVSSHQVDLTTATQTPKAGWAQMDPQAIVDSVDESARGALEKVLYIYIYIYAYR